MSIVNQVSQLYIGILGRAADRAGLEYWVNQVQTGKLTIEGVAKSFQEQPEWINGNGQLDRAGILNELYKNLFGREATGVDKAYWVLGEGASVPLEKLVLALIAPGAALGNDAIVLAQRTDAAVNFSFSDADTTDLEAAAAVITGVNGGSTFTLTSSVDALKITTANTVDTINGVVDGTTAANSTFSIGDTIEGNGKTVLRLAVADSGTAAFATVKNIGDIQLVAGDTGTIDFNAVDWTGVGRISLNAGVDGLVGDFSNLAVGTGLVVGSGVGGELNAVYTNKTEVNVQSDRGAAISYLGGNVEATAAKGKDVSFDIEATAASTAVTVGNVNMVGTEADDATLSVTNTQAKGGDVTVGNVSITGFDGVWAYVNNDSHTVDSAAVNTTVGNVNLGVNKSGSMDFSVENTASDTTAAAVDVGNLKVGNIAVNLAQAATGNVYLENYAYNGGAGAAVIGNTEIGNITLDLATDASLTIDIEATADAGTGAATVGNFTLGDVLVNQGINSDVSISIDIDADGGANKGGVGTITLGAMTLNLDDGADFDFDLSASSEKNIGNISIGALTANLGVSATATVEHEFYALKSVGTIAVGDIEVNAGVNAYFWGSLDVSAADTAIGNVTFGNISMNAAKDAYAGYWAYLEAETALGNVTVGDVNVNAIGENASASVGFDLSNDSDGKIGNIVVGDVAVVANGKNAWGGFYLDASSADTVGTTTIGNVTLTANGESASADFSVSLTADVSVGKLTVGDFDVSIDPGAKKAGNSVEVDIYSYGDIELGDITVNAATPGATDNAMTYTVDFDISSTAGDVTIGNITVIGGGYQEQSKASGLADNLDTLTSWLDLSAGGDITIGNVDYSAYQAEATIDVSGFKGAAEIKGGVKADTITDNSGTNSIWGGAGADEFNFVTTNTGKTLETMDKIMDFSNSQGDKLFFGALTVDASNYTEATATSFADFVTGSNAADKAVYVGLITGVNGLVVAVDHNTDGTVDFMVQLVGVNSLASIDVGAFQ